MKSRGNFRLFLSVFQIFLLISMTFAFSFLLGQEVKVVSAGVAPSATLTGTAASPTPGQTYMQVNINGNQQIARWIGTKDGVASGVLSNGQQVTWPKIPNNEIIYATPKDIAMFNGGEVLSTKDGLTTIKTSSGAAVYDSAGKLVANKETTTVFGTTFTGASAHLIQGLQASLFVAGAIQLVGTLAGLDQQQTNAVTISAVAGIMAWKGLNSLGSTGAAWVKDSNFFLKNSGWVGLAVGVAVLLLIYKEQSEKVVTFECLPWEPKLGGARCEDCNNDPFKPCSEYRCKSLGQACELLNKDSANPQCAWVSKGDVQSPTIREWTEALKPTGLQYTPANAVRPGARGVSIVSPETSDGCLPAFTSLQFGIQTNEPAQCKIDYNRSVEFDSMTYYLGESNFYAYNHTQNMRLPGSDAAAPLLQNDGTFGLSVRCRDANGNVNEDEYLINFCVQQGPDTTAPIVEGTSLEDGSPVRFGSDNVELEVYTNEPATCKWSETDRDYNEMENTFNCAQTAAQVNADLQYTCSGNLTGIANNAAKEFFIRCQDQPTAVESERNTMSSSHKISLRGSVELSLLSAGPNSTTISASTSVVPVELFAQTDDGADNGEARCYFSSTGVAGSYVEFFETGSINHKQTLSLSDGNYTYGIRCIDAGGNNAETNVTFSVSADSKAPEVTRVYKRGDDALQIITNEPAQCYYSKTSCNFNILEGLQLTYPSSEQQRVHLTQWKAKSMFYIKCRDIYGNEPSPNSCSIVVSGSDLSPKAVEG